MNYDPAAAAGCGGQPHQGRWNQGGRGAIVSLDFGSLSLWGLRSQWNSAQMNNRHPHCNPLQGSTGKYRENPVMKTGTLQ